MFYVSLYFSYFGCACQGRSNMLVVCDAFSLACSAVLVNMLRVSGRFSM
jgi:hypothetical protein